METATSPAQMISISEATEIVVCETRPLGTETIRLEHAVGRVLAQNIVADADLPPFDRSQMDGFAVRAADVAKVPVSLRIVGESAAGRGWHQKMKAGEAVRIMTGASVPKGADAVQQVEFTSEADPQAGTKTDVEIVKTVKPGTAIVPKGSEVKRGDLVLASGQVITDNMVAAIASFGYSTITVSVRPRVGILSTGNEIVDVAKKPGLDQIRNSNSLMIKAMAESSGGLPRIHAIAGDHLNRIKRQILTSANRSDVLVITGGVSVGKYDLTKLALRELGARIFFERVSLKPGKPTVFAKLGDTLVFGLPGNPVSAAVTFQLFARRAILLLQNAAEPYLRRGFAVLDAPTKGVKDRDSYVAATLDTNVRGQLVATALRSKGSSDFISFARAGALIFVERGTGLLPGDIASILFLP